MTEPPNTEALLATVRTALRQGQRAMNELVWTHATLDPEAALDAIASELERRQAHIDEIEGVANLRERGDDPGEWITPVQKVLMERRRAETAEAELKRVRAERDEQERISDAYARDAHGYKTACGEAEARLDRAVGALREIEQGYDPYRVARAALAEIEESG